MPHVRFSCERCPSVDVCQAPCPAVERRLPQVPCAYREKTYGLWPEIALVQPFMPPSRGDLPDLRLLLTRRERQALHLVFVDNLSQAAAAKRLRITRSALRNRLERVRRKFLHIHRDQNLLL